MKVFICKNHDVMYIGNASSMIVAKDRREARKLLDKELINAGLRPYEKRKYDLEEIDINKAHVAVFCNGDY